MLNVLRRSLRLMTAPPPGIMSRTTSTCRPSTQTCAWQTTKSWHSLCSTYRSSCVLSPQACHVIVIDHIVHRHCRRSSIAAVVTVAAAAVAALPLCWPPLPPLPPSANVAPPQPSSRRFLAAVAARRVSLRAIERAP